MNWLGSLLAHGLLLPLLCAQDDLLRFQNGDQLHGAYRGIAAGGVILFRSAEMENDAEFKVSKLRHIVLRGGSPERPLDTLTNVVLTNGDRIPGKILGLDGEHVSLDSEITGSIRIPRDRISMLAVNPMSGRIHYLGPFSDAGWDVLKHPDCDQSGKNHVGATWQFSGSSWYWHPGEASRMGSSNSLNQALFLREVMGDRTVLRFRVDWRDRLGISIAFHARLPQEAPDEDTEKMKRAREQRAIPSLFGNAYVLQLYPTHHMLFRSVWGKDGVALDRVQTSSTNMQMDQDRSAIVEIRSNRADGRISLFVNDGFCAQWDESAGGAGDQGEGFSGKGDGIGFSVMPGFGAVRISEITCSDWNGMPDSARSMELENRDVILMNNGTDRFSGKVLRLNGGGEVEFEGVHGKWLLPMGDISEIRFARSSLAGLDAEPDDEDCFFHFRPLGRISGRPLSGDAGLLRVRHPVLGEIGLGTPAMTLIEYQPGQRISDLWNEDL